MSVSSPAAVAVDTVANLAVVVGALSSDPRPRRLASGADLVSFEVTTDGSPRDSVPVTMFDPTALAASLAEGDQVVVIGRVRRRFFRAGGVTQSRTEVVAERIARTRVARSRRAALELAARRLADLAAAADD